MKAALLPDRGVVKVAGEAAAKFLDGLITADIDKVTATAAQYGALLTPQGKVIADFIVVKGEPEEHYFLDCPRALAPTLVQRLNFYKLRAKVMVEDLSDVLGVLAAWDGNPAGLADGLPYPDPRLPDLGTRCMLPPHRAGAVANNAGAALVDTAAYEAHRIALGVPQGGIDFAYGDAFPHEADMDQLNGVDFDKGCFVGQEVVSRMEHRATARARVVPVTFEGAAPAHGTPVTAAERSLGTIGSGIVGRALALLRLDRVEDALAAGTPITAGGVVLQPSKPAWARFAFPRAVTAS
jgi:tRNA-modifying protein YgfZ